MLPHLPCSAKPKGGTCLLEKYAVPGFWLCVAEQWRCQQDQSNWSILGSFLGDLSDINYPEIACFSYLSSQSVQDKYVPKINMYDFIQCYSVELIITTIVVIIGPKRIHIMDIAYRGGVSRNVNIMVQ